MPDPYDAVPSSPESSRWNRSSYVSSALGNSNDPMGLCLINGREYPDGLPPRPDVTSISVRPSTVTGGVWQFWMYGMSGAN